MLNTHIKHILGLFILALAVRSIWLLGLYDAAILSDSRWYLDAATSLAKTSTYTDNGRITAFWPVGYPFFLSLFFRITDSPLFLIQLFQILLSSISAVLVFQICFQYSDDMKKSRFISLLFIFYPASISMASVYMSETLFTFLILSGFWVAQYELPAIRPKALLVVVPAGILFGLSAYVRPVVLLALPLIYLPLAAQKNWRAYGYLTAGVVCTVFLMLSPWMVRNYRLYHEVVPVSTNLGMNLYIGNHAESTGKYMDIPQLQAMLEEGRSETEISSHFKNKAVAYIFSNPGTFIKRTCVKLIRLSVFSRDPVYASFTRPENPNFKLWQKALAAFNNLYYLAILFVVLILVFKREISVQKQNITEFLVFVLFVSFHALFFEAHRFVFPASVFLILTLKSLPLPKAKIPG